VGGVGDVMRGGEWRREWILGWREGGGGRCVNKSQAWRDRHSGVRHFLDIE
jgi:hypothetical protein